MQCQKWLHQIKMKDIMFKSPLDLMLLEPNRKNITFYKLLYIFSWEKKLNLNLYCKNDHQKNNLNWSLKERHSVWNHQHVSQSFNFLLGLPYKVYCNNSFNCFWSKTNWNLPFECGSFKKLFSRQIFGTERKADRMWKKCFCQIGLCKSKPLDTK